MPTCSPFVESARDRLGVLLSLLLGFSLPMALPHYEQRIQLVTDENEASAISTVAQRAQMLPETYRRQNPATAGGVRRRAPRICPHRPGWARNDGEHRSRKAHTE